MAKKLRSWMQAHVRDAIEAELRSDQLDSFYGTARNIAWRLRSTLRKLLGDERQAHEHAAFLAKVHDDDVDLDVVDSLIEAIGPHAEDDEDPFRLAKGHRAHAVRAVIRALGLRFGRSPRLSLPRTAETLFEQALRSARGGTLIEALVPFLESAGHLEVGRVVRGHGARFARHFEGSLPKDLEPEHALWLFASELDIELTGPRPPPRLDPAQARPYAAGARFDRGQVVSHPRFGLGKVESVTDSLVEIRFSDDSTRRLAHGRG